MEITQDLSRWEETIRGIARDCAKEAFQELDIEQNLSKDYIEPMQGDIETLGSILGDPDEIHDDVLEVFEEEYRDQTRLLINREKYQ